MIAKKFLQSSLYALEHGRRAPSRGKLGDRGRRNGRTAPEDRQASASMRQGGPPLLSSLSPTSFSSIAEAGSGDHAAQLSGDSRAVSYAPPAPVGIPGAGPGATQAENCGRG